MDYDYRPKPPDPEPAAKPVGVKPQLLINKDTWHYRYFIFIRTYWGFDKEPTRTSLCPYCQTMFWFSLAALVLGPLVVLGWVLLKMFRIVYKVMSILGFENFIDFVDKSPFGKMLAKSDQAIQDSPGATALFAVVVSSLTIGTPAVLLFGILTCLYHIYLLIDKFPSLLMHFVLCIGYGIFSVFWCLGWLLHVIWGWLFAVSHNTLLWMSIGYWSAVVFCIGMISIVIFYVFYSIGRTNFGRSIWDFIVFRLNGYGDARKAAVARREARKSERDQAEMMNPTPPGIFSRFFAWVKRKVMGHEFKVGQKVGKVLTPFGIIWEFFVGMKNNACPIIEFIEKPKESKEEHT